MKRLLAAAVALLALTGCAPANAEPAAPATVTASPTPAPARTIYAAPAGCDDALEAADKLINLQAEAIRLHADTFDAAASGDVERMNANTAKVGRLAEEAQPARSDYMDARSGC